MCPVVTCDGFKEPATASHIALRSKMLAKSVRACTLHVSLLTLLLHMSPGLQVYEQYLLLGLKYINGTYFGLFGAQGVATGLGSRLCWRPTWS